MVGFLFVLQRHLATMNVFLERPTLKTTMTPSTRKDKWTLLRPIPIMIGPNNHSLNEQFTFHISIIYCDISLMYLSSNVHLSTYSFYLILFAIFKNIFH